jgi:glycosyltransferase involved in cell wall biosynthesis
VIRVLADHSIGADSVAIVPTWHGARHLNNMALLARAARYIAGTPKGTVAHFHVSNGGAWLRDGPLALIARRYGLRVVITLHGPEFAQFAQSRPRLVTAILRQAHHVIALSDETKDLVERLVPTALVHICPNPVEMDVGFSPADRTPPVALFAGEVSRRKGADILLTAWRILESEGVPGECRIVGPQRDVPLPRNLPGLSSFGSVHPREMRPLIRGARVVVLPSREEAMPMILTEALASGRPFVATAVGGNRSIAPRPQELLRVGDARGLAVAIRRYLTDPSLALRAGEEGRAYCRATRSPEVIARRLRPIYQS